MDAGYFVLEVNDKWKDLGFRARKVPADNESFGSESAAIEAAACKNASAPEGTCYIAVALESDGVEVNSIDYTVDQTGGRMEVTMTYPLRSLEMP